MKKIRFLMALIALTAITFSPCYAQQWAKTYDGTYLATFTDIQLTTDGSYVVAGHTYAGDDFWILKLDASGSIIWQKKYGEAGAMSPDTAQSIDQTADGGYIVAGRSWFFGADQDCDFWVVKLDSEGNVGPEHPGTWQKIYGSYNPGDWEGVDSVRQTPDGGYVVAGSTDSFPSPESNTHVWILKLDPSGDIVWQKTYATFSLAYNHGFNSIMPTTDGGFVLASMTFAPGPGGQDLWVVKLDSEGNVGPEHPGTWQRSYGGSSLDEGRCVQQTTDGGYIVAGYTSSFGAGYMDIWVLKLDSAGDVIWEKAYGQSNDDEKAWSIRQAMDGGYIVVGYTSPAKAPNEDGYDILVLKLDSNGNLVWQRTYGGDKMDLARSVQQSADGDYVIAGATESFDYAGFVLKLDGNGEIPGCSSMGPSAAVVSDTWAIVTTTEVVPEATFVEPVDTDVSPQDTVSVPSSVCEIPSAECELAPDATVVPRGGTLGFQATVMNNIDDTSTVLFATKVTLPGGGVYPASGFLDGPFSVYLNNYGSASGHLYRYIPVDAPVGTYIYHGNVGTYDMGVFHRCQFEFEVVEP